MNTTSPFAAIEQAPPDPILGLTEAYNADASPSRVNLGVGVYQDGSGRVPVLRAVREAEARWHDREETKTYLPIDGVPAYNAHVQALLLGEGSSAVAEKRAVTVQAPGGTGALRVGADFLRRFFPNSGLWISTPSWENHRALFEAAGFTVNQYPYYDPATHGLDSSAMCAAIERIPAGDVVLMHACCHNPSGVDPTPEQWRTLIGLFQGSGRIPFLDFAYQGLGDGLDEDALAVRLFAEAGVPCLVSSSFSKSFSLYRERVGALTLITASAEEAKRTLSQLKRVIRTNYSNPPSHGAQVVATVLGDTDLRAMWLEELAEMRERIQAMRCAFVAGLAEQGVKQDFRFIERQKGMFSFSGLSKQQVHRLRQEYSLYIVDSGRVCVAALNPRNIGYVCKAIASVIA